MCELHRLWASDRYRNRQEKMGNGQTERQMERQAGYRQMTVHLKDFTPSLLKWNPPPLRRWMAVHLKHSIKLGRKKALANLQSPLLNSISATGLWVKEREGERQIDRQRKRARERGQQIKRESQDRQSERYSFPDGLGRVPPPAPSPIHTVPHESHGV